MKPTPSSKTLLSNTIAERVMNQPLKYYLPELQEAIFAYIDLLIDCSEELTDSQTGEFQEKEYLLVDRLDRNEAAILELINLQSGCRAMALWLVASGGCASEMEFVAKLAHLQQRGLIYCSRELETGHFWLTSHGEAVLASSRVSQPELG